MSALSPEDVFAVVRDAIVTVLSVDPGSVGRTTTLRTDLRADSLALVEVVEIVEEALLPHARPGFRIEDQDLDGFRTVGDAVDYAVARL